jgi:hypothetical protein
MGFKEWKERFLVRMDQRMTRWENSGFRVANRMHRYAVNGIVLYLCYQIFDFLRSYNDLFLHLRQTNKYDEQDLEGPINRGDE